MNRLLRLLSRTAFRRGVTGGSRPWLYLWVVASVVTWMRKRSADPPPVLHTEVLEPGEAVRISVLPPGS